MIVSVQGSGAQQRRTGGGDKAQPGRGSRRPAQHSWQGRQQQGGRAPAAAPLPQASSWQAIKQQAHQGFEQLLRQAGLPVNAGFSRPSSFSAAAGAYRPHLALSSSLGPPPPPLPPPWAMPGWAPPQHQQPQHLPQQHQQQIGAYCPPLPPEPPAMPGLQPHSSFWPAQLGWPGTQASLASPPAVPTMAWASREQHPELPLRYSSPPSAAQSHPWLDPSPVLRSSSRSRSSGSRRSSSSSDGDLLQQKEAGMGSFMGTVPALPEATGARLGTASSAELPPKPERPQQLLKLDSDACASSTWQAAGFSVGKAASERASSTGSAAAENMQTNSNGNTSFRSSNRSSGSLGSSALEALVAAAEEADIPRVESEAWEADSPMSLSAPAACAEQGASQPAEEEEEGEDTLGDLTASQAADEILTPAAPDSPPDGPAVEMQRHAALATPAGLPPPGGDLSAAASAALARFEQLQQQLQTLQASLPPALLEEGAAAAAAGSSAASQPQSPHAAGAAPQTAADPLKVSGSPVLVVMHQAESFLAQAQALLHRLHAAAARDPQQPMPLAPQHAPQHAWQPLGLPPRQDQAAIPAPMAPASYQPPHSTSQRLDAGGGIAVTAAEPALLSSPAEVQGLEGEGPSAHLSALSQQWQGMAWSTGAPAALPPTAFAAAHWPWEQQQQQPAAQLPQQDRRNSWQAQQQQSGLPPRGLMWPQPGGSFASTSWQGAASDRHHQPSWHQQRQPLLWQQHPWQHLPHSQQRLSVSEQRGGYAQRQQAAAAAAMQAALPSAPARQQQGSYVQAARLAKVGLPR